MSLENLKNFFLIIRFSPENNKIARLIRVPSSILFNLLKTINKKIYSKKLIALKINIQIKIILRANQETPGCRVAETQYGYRMW